MIMIIPMNRLSATLCSLFIQVAGLYFSTWHSPSKTEWLSSDHFGMPLWPHELSVDAEEGAVLLAAESTNFFIRWIARCSLGPLLHNSVCPAVHLYILRGAGWVGKDCNALNLQRWVLSATEERDLGIETKGGSAREIDLWVSGVYSPPRFTTQPTYFIYEIDHLNVLGKFWSG